MQGKEYTQAERNNILETIKPYLQMGDSIATACKSAGIEPWSIYKWCEKDETLSNKISSWQNMVNAIAKQQLIKTIRGEKNEKGEWIIPPNDENAKWWLERREKKEFGRNVDVTSDGKEIKSVDKVEWIVIKKTDNETEPD